ncbi:zinc-binding dehydrogenase [Candidatus Palauibacter sp.]|uniref:zinc-binding dehydrogenase n=1 Tax=Candidatus Palauibacter sp. TaxID=3101350 RepID=UPI003AF303DB
MYGSGPVGGRRILVQGGAGAVGHLAVQLANLGTDVAVLCRNGTIASYSSTSGPELRLDYYPLAFRDARIHFVQGYLLPAPARRAAIRDLTTWLAAGQLEVRIAKAFPLAETASAHELLESGRAGGKVLVEI